MATRSLQARRASQGSLAAVTLAILLIATGCGRNDGPQRYDLSGAVTLDGQPIPRGRITFRPDTTKGNSGPGTGAEIENGYFETPRGKGTVGGPHHVDIIGYDGTQQGMDLPYGLPIMRNHYVDVDLPREDATHDFDVPAAVRWNPTRESLGVETSAAPAEN